jgi:hypothetical protein
VGWRSARWSAESARPRRFLRKQARSHTGFVYRANSMWERACSRKGQTSQNCALSEHAHSNTPPFSASQSDKNPSRPRSVRNAFYRPSPVLAVTFRNIGAQARSHKCYRFAHTRRSSAFAAADGTSNQPLSDVSYRHVATSFSGVIERPFNFRHGNCSVITKPVSHARTMAITRASA